MTLRGDGGSLSLIRLVSQSLWLCVCLYVVAGVCEREGEMVCMVVGVCVPTRVFSYLFSSSIPHSMRLPSRGRRGQNL